MYFLQNRCKAAIQLPILQLLELKIKPVFLLSGFRFCVSNNMIVFFLGSPLFVFCS